MSRSLEPAQGMASIMVAAAAGNVQRVKKPVLVHSALAAGCVTSPPAVQPACVREGRREGRGRRQSSVEGLERSLTGWRGAG